MNKIWFFIFNVFSVYYVSQILQMSSFINSSSHNLITGDSLVYNGLYTILVVLGLHQLNNITDTSLSIKEKIVYTLCCHLGAISFALAGEISFLHEFTLTAGFWEKLSFEAKLVVGIGAIILLLLVCLQGRKAYKQNKIKKQCFPWLVILVIWFILGFVVFIENIPYHIHIHHVLFAGFFSSWFDDFDSMFDIVLNAFFIGIVIQGIDFYGIDELSLFSIDVYDDISMSGILIVIGLITFVCSNKSHIEGCDGYIAMV